MKVVNLSPEKNMKKTPTLKEKVKMYEDFLHKINLFVTTVNNDGIRELVQNADTWSYMHRVGNGEFSDGKQQSLINQAFWKLCDTLNTDNESRRRQKAWQDAQTSKKICRVHE
jgi:hypothetical protein